jgi:hypothetical protein
MSFEKRQHLTIRFSILLLRKIFRAHMIRLFVVALVAIFSSHYGLAQDFKDVFESALQKGTHGYETIQGPISGHGWESVLKFPDFDGTMIVKHKGTGRKAMRMYMSAESVQVAQMKKNRLEPFMSSLMPLGDYQRSTVPSSDYETGSVTLLSAAPNMSNKKAMPMIEIGIEKVNSEEYAFVVYIIEAETKDQYTPAFKH